MNEKSDGVFDLGYGSNICNFDNEGGVGYFSNYSGISYGSRHVEGRRSVDGLSGCSMHVYALGAHVSVESVVCVRGVLHNALCTVSDCIREHERLTIILYLIREVVVSWRFRLSVHYHREKTGVNHRN